MLSRTTAGKVTFTSGPITDFCYYSAAALAAGKEKKKAAETKKSVKVRAVHSDLWLSMLIS